MSRVSVRYIVNDVNAAVGSYATHLAFQVEMHPGPGFARLSRGDLRLLLDSPGAAAPVSPCLTVSGRSPEGEPKTDRGQRSGKHG